MRQLIAVTMLLLILLAFAGIALMQRSTALPVPAKSDWQAYINANQTAGYLQPALYAIQRAAAETGWTPGLHQQAADIWYRIGDYAQALPHYESAALNTTDALLMRRLVELYLQAGRPQEALTGLQRLLTLDTQNPWAHYQAGLLLAASDPRAAREHLTQVAFNTTYASTVNEMMAVLNVDVSDPVHNMQTGAMLARLKLYQYAEWAFKYAADSNSPFAEALAYTGLMRDLQGKDGGAVIQQAISTNPNSADVWLVQGVHLRIKADYTNSQVALLNALMLDPQNPAIHAELGSTYRAAGAIDDAAYWLQSAVQVSGNDPSLSQALTQFYTDEAVTIPQKALSALSAEASASPNNPDALSAYGWALHVTGDSALGLAKIDEALNLDPTSIRAMYDKARVLIDTGVTDQGKALLQQVAASNTIYAAPAKNLLAGMS